MASNDLIDKMGDNPQFLIEPVDDIGQFCNLRDSGVRVLVSQEIYEYFLGVLPPVNMNCDVTLVDGTHAHAAFCFAEGWSVITAFWRTTDGRYFAQNTIERNRG